MGTLFNQRPRDYCDIQMHYLDSFLHEMTCIAKKHGIPLSEVLKAREILEWKRANDLFVADGDSKDEQLMGFGELLKETNQCLSDIYLALSKT